MSITRYNVVISVTLGILAWPITMVGALIFFNSASYYQGVFIFALLFLLGLFLGYLIKSKAWFWGGFMGLIYILVPIIMNLRSIAKGPFSREALLLPIGCVVIAAVAGLLGSHLPHKKV